ncbi:MAG TPA: hypothetical protein VMH41_10065 [Mycobacteriales bacterium]|nr:hypothetical protein [Mycobacteriales bacterium]
MGASVANFPFLDGATFTNVGADQYYPVYLAHDYGVTVSTDDYGTTYLGIRCIPPGESHAYHQEYLYSEASTGDFSNPLLSGYGFQQPDLVDSACKPLQREGWAFKNRYLYIVADTNDVGDGVVIFSCDLNDEYNNSNGWIQRSKHTIGGGAAPAEGIAMVDSDLGGTEYKGVVYLRRTMTHQVGMYYLDTTVG